MLYVKSLIKRYVEFVLLTIKKSLLTAVYKVYYLWLNSIYILIILNFRLSYFKFDSGCTSGEIRSIYVKIILQLLSSSSRDNLVQYSSCLLRSTNVAVPLKLEFFRYHLET